MTTPRERVQQAFAFNEVRPVPYTVWYDHETMLALNAHYGSTAWRERIQDHILRLTVNWEPEYDIDETHFTDIHGSVWERGNPKHLVGPVLTEPSLRGVDIPHYPAFMREAHTVGETAGGRHNILPLLSIKDAEKRLAAARDRVFTVAGYGNGLFEAGWMMRGYENFFSDLLLEPAFIDDLLDLLLERHLELLDELMKLPCDGVIFSDDYGDQRGVIIGPQLWRRFVKPRLAKLYERVHAAGKMTFQHTCGSVFDIIPDLIEIGLDVLQSLQPEAMPVYEIKKRYGDRLRLWGGLGTQQLLPFGTPAEIRAEVRHLKQEMGCGGGYVLTSSKPVMREVPVANAVAFVEEVLGDTV